MHVSASAKQTCSLLKASFAGCTDNAGAASLKGYHFYVPGFGKGGHWGGSVLIEKVFPPFQACTGLPVFHPEGNIGNRFKSSDILLKLLRIHYQRLLQCFKNDKLLKQISLFLKQKLGFIFRYSCEAGENDAGCREGAWFRIEAWWRKWCFFREEDRKSAESMSSGKRN